jgi:hypothetical protein
MAIQIRSLSNKTSSDFGLISFIKSQEIYGNSSLKRNSSDFGLFLFNKSQEIYGNSSLKRNSSYSTRTSADFGLSFLSSNILTANVWFFISWLVSNEFFRFWLSELIPEGLKGSVSDESKKTYLFLFSAFLNVHLITFS